MIPIEYDQSKLKGYNNFIENFIKKINQGLLQGYIGNKKRLTKKEARTTYNQLSPEQRIVVEKLVDIKEMFNDNEKEKILFPRYILDSDSRAFFLETKTSLKEWCEYKPQKIRELCNRLMDEYKAFIDHQSQLYLNVYYIFVQRGYDNDLFPKGELIDASHADVCPYCNRTFIRNVTGKDGKQIKGQLDHFLDKDTYPFLAILKYNLVPSCPYCNGPTGKHTKDAIKEGLVSPFELESADELTFKIKILNANITDVTKCTDAMSLDIICKNDKMKNNKCIFHIQELYHTHMDYAAEVYLKTRMMESSAYITFVERLTHSHFPICPTELILGFSLDPQTFKSRPISKFRTDIYNDITKK